MGMTDLNAYMEVYSGTVTGIGFYTRSLRYNYYLLIRNVGYLQIGKITTCIPEMFKTWCTNTLQDVAVTMSKRARQHTLVLCVWYQLH